MTCEAHDALEAAARGRRAARSGVDAGERDRAREEDGAQFLRRRKVVEEVALGSRAPCPRRKQLARRDRSPTTWDEIARERAELSA